MSEAAALEGMDLLAKGKVRDIYAVGEDRLLLATSDRISTYDVIHPTPIPDKGKVLTGLSVFWFERTGDICPNHLISFTDVPEEARGRALLVERLEMVPVECVVRGYITGSGWKDYQANGAVCGIELPEGLEESEQLPEPIFTPATKAEVGDHDENVDFDRAAEIVGDRALLEELRRLSIALYEHAAEHARSAGIILADTKFEFGRRADGTVVLGDEACTPDSSRFWPADGYAPGRGQPSFDKQYVRDWATGVGMGQVAPGAADPDEGRGRHPGALRGGLRADRRRALRPLARSQRVRPVKARVLIRPKAGILDPQGQAVERALPALGFDGVENVRIGRMVELEVGDTAPRARDVRAAAGEPPDRGLRGASNRPAG